MAAPPFLVRTKRLLSNRLSVCRLRVDACHVLPAARSHLILHTLVLHDRSVMPHVSLSELAYVLEKSSWCRSSIECDLDIVSRMEEHTCSGTDSKTFMRAVHAVSHLGGRDNWQRGVQREPLVRQGIEESGLVALI
jgi:hypothetical protein